MITTFQYHNGHHPLMRRHLFKRSLRGSGSRSFQSTILMSWQLVGLETTSEERYASTLLLLRAHVGGMHVFAWRWILQNLCSENI
ncbi:hypothetical protein LINPERHAP2_LOCUS10865 [Linum perenne]